MYILYMHEITIKRVECYVIT